MSFVTSIILIFSSLEDEKLRISEVNSFLVRGNSINLKSIEHFNNESFQWYGGSKSLLSNIYVGSYNYLDLEKFLIHISKVKWEEPQYVQLLIRTENEYTYRIYVDVGKTLALDSFKE